MDVRVVSYNVHGRRDDRAALASVVRDLQPDIVVVQEGPRGFRWRTRAATIAHGWGMYYAAGGVPSLGNLILTTLRAHVDAAHCVRFPLTPGRHLRGAALVRVTVGGVNFVVAGSHLSTDDAERPGQARLFRAAVDEFAAGRPAVVAADLNDEPGSASWTIVGEGLTDTGDDRPTFPVASPRRRIDAIFTDPRIEVAAYDRPDTLAVRAASDHFPLVVDLRL